MGTENPVRMTRRVGFSSGHRYWLAHLSPEDNRQLFGPWASPYNHGHNYVLDVTVSGGIDPITGMIVNIKRIDDVLRAGIVAEFDQRSMNDEIPWFANHAPSMENVLRYCAIKIRATGFLPPECELVSLKLEEMPTLWSEWKMDGSMTLTRTYEFAASHRLHAPALSDAENLDRGGECNNEAGHGHNYILEVTVTGNPSEVTGMIVDLNALDEVVNAEVVDRHDHKNLNLDIDEFVGRPTTTEIVTQEIFARLKDTVPAELVKVKLWETARNAFEVGV